VAPVRNLEITWHQCAISRLRGTSAQSRDYVAPVRNLEITWHQYAILRLRGTSAQCRDYVAPVRNLEITWHQCVILRLRGTSAQCRDYVAPVRNLKIMWHQCTISRSRGTGVQSRDCAVSEPFEFPLCKKVRNVRNELLQLRCHHQCWACILKPPHQVLLGSLPTRGNSLSLSLGTGAESSQTCGVPPFKASSSRRALNCLPLVSSDAFTPRLR